jgi:hypothetical protein
MEVMSTLLNNQPWDSALVRACMQAQSSFENQHSEKVGLKDVCSRARLALNICVAAELFRYAIDKSPDVAIDRLDRYRRVNWNFEWTADAHCHILLEPKVPFLPLWPS